jgi:hypothetical protein
MPGFDFIDDDDGGKNFYDITENTKIDEVDMIYIVYFVNIYHECPKKSEVIVFGVFDKLEDAHNCASKICDHEDDDDENTETMKNWYTDEHPQDFRCRKFQIYKMKKNIITKSRLF